MPLRKGERGRAGKILGVGVFPSATSLIVCPPVPKKLDVHWQNFTLSGYFEGTDRIWRGMKAPSCVSPATPPSPWHLLIYDSDTFFSLLLPFFHLFFHLSSCFCFSRLTSPRVSFCVHIKGRVGLWQPLELDRVCVCPPACQVKEQGGDLQLYLYSFILHQASCRPSFYDCHIRYLTYHCHKAQQTQGRGNCTCTQHAYMCYWNELMVELQTDVHNVMSEVLLYRIMHLSQDSKLGRLWYHLLHLFACQPYYRSLSLLRSVQTAFWTSMQHANNIHHPPFFGSDKIIRHQHKEVFCILRQRSCYKTS